MALPEKRCRADDEDMPMDTIGSPPSCDVCPNGQRQYERGPAGPVVPDQDALLAARTEFLARGAMPGGIPLAIIRSWQRSQKYGLAGGSPSMTWKPASRLTEAALSEALERNEELMRSALGEMEPLCRDTQSAGGVVVLTDPNGIILLRVGDCCFAEEADRLGLRAGGDWSERSVGTNAIGTTVSEQHALSVIGAEHFLAQNMRISCSAVPIVDPCGALVGVLDLSTSIRISHDYTLPLLRRAAEQIERRLFELRFGLHEQMHLHSNPYLLGSSHEGVLAFDGDRLVGANRNAMDLLGLNWSAVGSLRFRQIFSVLHGSVMRCASSDECVVQTIRGSTFFARMQAPPPRTTPTSPAASHAPPPIRLPDRDRLPHEVLEAIKGDGAPAFQKMKAGHILYGADLMDVAGEAVLVIRDGQMRCFSSHEGKELTLFVLGAGDVVPLQEEMMVEARVDSEAAIIRRTAFRRLTRDHPEFAVCVLPAVEKALNRSLAIVDGMAFRSVRYRLIRLLCETAQREGHPSAEGTVIDDFPQGDHLATAVGAARQSVSTVLADLVRSGELRRAGAHSVLIPDLAQLEEELRVLR